jgi:hypothetical protein
MLENGAGQGDEALDANNSRGASLRNNGEVALSLTRKRRGSRHRSCFRRVEDVELLASQIARIIREEVRRLAEPAKDLDPSERSATSALFVEGLSVLALEYDMHLTTPKSNVASPEPGDSSPHSRDVLGVVQELRDVPERGCRLSTGDHRTARLDGIGCRHDASRSGHRAQ